MSRGDEHEAANHLPIDKRALEIDIADLVAKVSEMTLPELSKLASELGQSSVDPEIDLLDMVRSAPRFIDRGYRLQKSNKRTNHRGGGKSQMPPPKCAICDMPLVLFVNLDATDRCLRGEHSLDRLTEP